MDTTPILSNNECTVQYYVSFRFRPPLDVYELRNRDWTVTSCHVPAYIVLFNKLTVEWVLDFRDASFISLKIDFESRSFRREFPDWTGNINAIEKPFSDLEYLSFKQFIWLIFFREIENFSFFDFRF